MATTTHETPKPRPKRRRRLLLGAGVALISVPALWVAIHEVPGLGPALADGARAILGPKAVAWAEDVAYDVQDRFDRWRYKDAKPKTFWEAPLASGAPTPSWREVLLHPRRERGRPLLPQCHKQIAPACGVKLGEFLRDSVAGEAHPLLRGRRRSAEVDAAMRADAPTIDPAEVLAICHWRR